VGNLRVSLSIHKLNACGFGNLSHKCVKISLLPSGFHNFVSSRDSKIKNNVCRNGI
jgi:hypothetical protein